MTSTASRICICGPFSPPLVAIFCSVFCVALASIILPVAGLVLAVMLLLGGLAARP